MALFKALNREDVGMVNPLEGGFAPGTTTAATLNSALTAIAGSTRTLLVPPGNWTINADVVVPANVHLWVSPGAILTTSPGVGLSIFGPLTMHGHFAGTGGLTIYGPVGDVLPEWWGTDLAAVQTAIYAATQGGLKRGRVRLSAGISYIGSTGLILPKYLTLCGEGTVVYSGAGAAVSMGPSDGILDNWHVTLDGITVRNAGGQYGVYLKDVADVDIHNIKVFGRNADGDVATGCTVAGVFLDATPSTGGVITTSMSNSYVQACAGDGIKGTNVNAINAITIRDSRIQGNLGWGVRFLGQVRALNIAGEKSIEGNAMGQIYVGGFYGLNISTYTEGATPHIALPGVVESSGGMITGCQMQGPGSGSAIQLGSVGGSFFVEGLVVEGNTIISFGEVYAGNKFRGCDLGLNALFFVTAEFGNVMGADAVGVGARLIGSAALSMGSVDTADVLIGPGSSAEGIIFTAVVPGHRLERRGATVIEVSGIYVNNHSASASSGFTIRVKYATDQYLIGTFGSVTASPNPRFFSGRIVFSGRETSTSEQGVSAVFLLTDPGATGICSPAMPPLVGENTLNLGNDSVNTGQVDVTAQHEVADADIHFTKKMARSYFLPQ